MPQDALTHLGLVPEQTATIVGGRRQRLIGFLLRWEQYEAALACLEEMLAFKPGLVSLLDAQARALLGLEQPDAALAVMQARHQIRTSLTSRALLARVLLARGDADAALAIAQQLVAEKPDSVTAWGVLGEVQHARGALDEALDAYQNLYERWPTSRSYLLGMLALYQAQGDNVTASGYAVRLQRSADDEHPLPAHNLRRLRDYYQTSGETHRVADVTAQLDALYQKDLTELEEALADELATRTRRPGKPAAPEAEGTDIPPAEPLPAPEAALPVSAGERARLEAAARDLFGHPALLSGQAETMAAVLRGEDVLTVLPTGGGKSLCYQLPALLDEAGTTLVISPLIALMKDQVDSLPAAARRRATTLNSSLDGQELGQRMRAVADGRYRLVYAAPERLRQPPFLHALRRAGLNRIVIDEAHCVSVWGHDFRPDYLYIAAARRVLGDPPLLAMTATAPPRVRRDILQRLSTGTDEARREMAVVASAPYRPNLYLTALRARNLDEKLRLVLALCRAETGSGIVYAGTRARCEQIAAMLQSQGVDAGYYHAGIGDRRARAAAQDTFMSGDVRVMVATIAFGMGVDKADIRFIIHLQLPASLEAYYQEAGRAGRDGQPAHCILIYSPSDRGTLTRRANRDAISVEFLRKVYAAVKRRLGDAPLGRIAAGDLMRDVRAEVTPVRVALSTLEEAGLLRRHRDLPRTAVVCQHDGRPAGSDDASSDPDWAAFLAAARLRPGQALPLDLLAVARAAGLDPRRMEARLLEWADAGRLDYRPVGRELLLELLPPPDDAPGRVQALLDRYATIQVQRVDEIVAYAQTPRCRHGHLSAYLSGVPLERCDDACDNCRAEPPAALAGVVTQLPDERAQLVTILRCAADAPWSWGQYSLINILRASSRAPEKGRTSSEWGALSFRSQGALKKLIDRLVHAGMFKPRTLQHGGTVLELTPAGRAALKHPERLAPLADVAPTAPAAAARPDDEELDQAGEALYERLRTWRHATAGAAGVPAYVVAHDALLRRIAAARPKDETALLALKGMGPKRMEKHGAALLAVVRGEEGA